MWLTYTFPAYFFIFRVYVKGRIIRFFINITRFLATARADRCVAAIESSRMCRACFDVNLTDHKFAPRDV